MLSKSLIQFSVDGRGCVSSLLFGLRPDYGRCNGDNAGNSDLLQKDLCLHCCIQCPWPCSSHCWPMPLLETPGHSQASLAQSVVGTLLLSPGSWCIQGFVCALQDSVSPVLWKFCSEMPLASEVKFPGDSQSFCWIPMLGNLLWVLDNFFVITVLQFVGCLLDGSMVGLMATSSKRLMPHTACPRSAAVRTPIPVLDHCWPMPPLETLKHSKSRPDSVPVGSLGSSVHKVLFEPSDHPWKVWGLLVNVISPFLSSCCGFSFALGHGVSFFSGIQHSPVSGYSAMSCNFGILSGEDEHTSFYSVILSLNVCVYLHIWNQSAKYTQDGFIATGVLWFLPDMEGGKNRIEKGRTRA